MERAANARKAEERGRKETEKRQADVAGRRRDRGRMYSNAAMSGIMGGAFPLLFGQGPGTAIGGGLGGAAGGAMGGMGGMALGIAGSAVGQAVDTFVANLTALADALKDPTQTLEAMEMAGLRVNSTLKYNVDLLNQANRGYDAQNIILQELKRQLGGDAGIQQLNALNAEQKKLKDEWGNLSSALAQNVLPVLTGTITLVNLMADAFKNLKAPPWISGGANFLGRAAQGLVPGAGAAGDAVGILGNIGRLRGAQEPATLPDTPQLQDQARLRREQLEDEARARENTIRSLQRAEEDLGRRRADIERSIGDLRQSILDRVFQAEQQAAQARAGNSRLATQIGIEQNDQRLANQAVETGGAGGALINQVREYIRLRDEGEAEIELRRRRFELELAQITRDNENFKRQIARQVDQIARARADYERSVEDYKRQTAEFQTSEARKQAKLIREAMAGLNMPGGTAGAGAIAGRTGGGQSGASRGRSSGPHLHAQGAGNLRAMVDAALEFPGGRTASSYGISRGADRHGYNAVDYLTPQGTPFKLRPGWTGTDMGVQGALGRGMRVTGPNGQSFELGHLEDVIRKGLKPLEDIPRSAGSASGGRGMPAASAGGPPPAPTLPPPAGGAPAMPQAEMSAVEAADQKRIDAAKERLDLEEKLQKTKLAGFRFGDVEASRNRLLDAEKELRFSEARLQVSTEETPLQQARADIANESLAKENEILKTYNDQIEALKTIKDLSPEEKARIKGDLTKTRDNDLGANQTQERTAANRLQDSINNEGRNNIQGLNQEIRIMQAELQAGYNEMSTLDRIVAEMGDKWDALPDDIRASTIEAANLRDRTAEQVEALNRSKQLYADLGRAIEDGIGDGIAAAITGAESLNEVLSRVLEQLGQILLNSALEGIFGQRVGQAWWLLAGLFGRASGGPVTGGTPYVVGEEGPELFIPGVSGAIAPNDMYAATREAVENGGPIPDSDADAEMFLPTRQSLSQMAAAAGGSVPAGLEATRREVSAITERQREQNYNEMRLGVLTGKIDPVEVKLDAFDPAGAGLATVAQAEQVARTTANTVQAQMLRRMRTDPGFRRKQGI